MKKIYHTFLTLSLTVMSTAIFGQTPGWEWADAAGDHGYESATAVAMDANGNAYITGSYTSAFIDFGTISLINTFSGTGDIHVVKYDPTGAVLWAKTFGGVDGDAATGITADASGNVVVTGWFASASITFGSTVLSNSGTASSDFYMVKFDASGNVLWAKSAGSTGNDRGQDLSTDASGNIFVTGWYSSPTINFGNGTLTNTGSATNEIFVVKYDLNGNALWSKTVGGTNNDAAWSCETDAFGNLYLTGSFASASIDFGSGALNNTQTGFHDFFLNKYDASGTSIWSRAASGAYDDIGYSVAISGTNIFVTGYFSSPTVQFGTIAALTNPGNPTTDIFVAQYSSTGTANWSNRAGGSDDDLGRCIYTDANGNAYVTGNYISTSITFGSGTLTNSMPGTKELFVTTFNSSGTSTWSTSVGNTGDECGYGIACSSSADIIYVGGMFNSGFVVFGNTTIYKGCGDDVFLAKFGTTTSAPDDYANENHLLVYPNPARDLLTINLKANSSVETIYLFDASGRLVMEEAVNGRTKIELNFVPYGSGVYMLKAGDDAMKIVVE